MQRQCAEQADRRIRFRNAIATQVAVVSSIPPGLRIDPRRNLLKLTGLTQGVKSMPRHAEAL